MSILIENLVEEWKKVPEYADVEGQYWEPNQPQVDSCPHGCDLEIYEDTSTKWARVSGYDVYRQTRICRQHGFARIYIITGPTAQASNWEPKSEL